MSPSISMTYRLMLRVMNFFFFPWALEEYHENKAEFESSGVFFEWQSRNRGFTFVDGRLQYPLATESMPQHPTDIICLPTILNRILPKRGGLLWSFAPNKKLWIQYSRKFCCQSRQTILCQVHCSLMPSTTERNFTTWEKNLSRLMTTCRGI